MMGDGRSVRGEEPGIEAPHAAGRGDGAGDQKQSGWVGQQAGLGERLPRAVEIRRGAIALAPETQAGFFAGLADRGDRQRSRARRRDLRTALQQIGFERAGNRRGNGNAVIRLVDTAAGKDELAGHEHHLVVALADQDFWDGGGAIDQDQRGGVNRSAIGVMIGFFLCLFFFDLFSLAHFAPTDPFKLPGCMTAIYGSGFFSSNPCIRNAHWIPTTAPFTGCSNSNDATSVTGK